MWVVAAHHIPDDFGALHMLAGRGQALLVHRVQDASLDGLETISDIRQGTAGDDGQRIVEIAILCGLPQGNPLFIGICGVKQ